jgi:hypothetical protein
MGSSKGRSKCGRPLRCLTLAADSLPGGGQGGWGVLDGRYCQGRTEVEKDQWIFSRDWGGRKCFFRGLRGLVDDCLALTQ